MIRRFSSRKSYALRHRTATSENTLIADWYQSAYPEDELGEEINPDVTFYDLFQALDRHQDIYKLLGDEIDSVIRERTFEELAKIMKCDYQYIYDQWLS